MDSLHFCTLTCSLTSKLSRYSKSAWRRGCAAAEQVEQAREGGGGKFHRKATESPAVTLVRFDTNLRLAAHAAVSMSTENTDGAADQASSSPSADPAAAPSA